MLEIRPQETLFLQKGVVLHSIPREDWYYAFNVDTGDQFQLNGSSFWILETLGSGVRWERLTDAFLKEYEVESTTGREDLARAVSEFIEQGLVGRHADADDQEAV